MKNKQKKEKYIMICPKCKSSDIYRDKSNPLQAATGLPDMYICNKCEFRGYTFPEIPISELEEFQEKIKKGNIEQIKTVKSKQIDTSYGKFIVNIWWKIFSPLTILLGLFITIKHFFGIFIIIIGLIMFYFAYLKKNETL
jgi:predicted RNA-binding Zn-ribbon protein involved in translation (DUF1610 family)